MSDHSNHEHEKSLVKRAASDPAAFQALYNLYFRRVYSYVAARVTSPLDAEDLVSDIFINVMKGLPQFENQQAFSFGAWIFTIARNLIIDFYRRRSRTVETHPLNGLENDMSDATRPERHLIKHEQAAELRLMLQWLPERRREVLILKYFSGLRNQEIAQVLDLDERTVASHLSRGLKDLYELYIGKLETD